MTPPTHCTVCGLPIAECAADSKGLLYRHLKASTDAFCAAVPESERVNVDGPIAMVSLEDLVEGRGLVAREFDGIQNRDPTLAITRKAPEPIATIKLPTCATCNRPVDRLTSERVPMMRATIFRAYCHGDRQETRLSDKQLVEAQRMPDGRLFALGRAFRGE